MNEAPWITELNQKDAEIVHLRTDNSTLDTVISDIASALGCAADNEAILGAIEKLQTAIGSAHNILTDGGRKASDRVHDATAVLSRALPRLDLGEGR